tara:strand:+ start:15061 stop:16743 length:1683 start_codon:yes stop_codon:yes gene_type:complete
MPRYGENDKYTFPYTFNDIQNPQGQNGLATSAKFFQRSVYKEAVYPDKEGFPLPLDTWYNKNLFGRVDRCQNTIVADRSNLVTVRKATTSNTYCLNFVEQAFHAFAEHMGDAFLNNCLARNGNKELWNIKAVRGYSDPSRKWKTFIDSLGDAFASEHIDRGDKVIKNISDFVPLFKSYLLYVAETYPINQESFYLSNNVSSYISGLTLSISRKSAADDYPKYVDYINDPNFEYYVRAAKKYGFLVDKNMPWVLTADVFASGLSYYTDLYQIEVDGLLYNINESNFFSIYYNKAYTKGFDGLRYIFERAYGRLILKKPLYAESKVLFRPDCASDPYQDTSAFRDPSTAALVNHLDDKFLIDLYISLRHAESKYSYPSLKSAALRAYDVYAQRPNKNHTAMRNVLDFVNQIYRVYVYPVNYGNINREIDLDKYQITDIIDTGVELGAEPLCTAAYQGGIAFEDNSIFEPPGPVPVVSTDPSTPTVWPPGPSSSEALPDTPSSPPGTNVPDPGKSSKYNPPDQSQKPAGGKSSKDAPPDQSQKPPGGKSSKSNSSTRITRNLY